MKIIARYWTLATVLITFFFGAISCTSHMPVDRSTPAQDRRTAFIHLLLETQNTNLGISVEEAKVSATYPNPWNPDGGAVPTVIVGIDGCVIHLNGLGPLLPLEDNNYSESEYLLEAVDQLGYDPPDRIRLDVELPSEEESYPDAYPVFTTSLPTYTIPVDIPEGSCSLGDTLRYTLHRDPDLEMGSARVEVETVYYRMYGDAEVIVDGEQTVVYPQEGVVDVILPGELLDDATTLRVSMRYLAHSEQQSVKMVDNKTALVYVHEYVNLVREFSIVPAS